MSVFFVFEVANNHQGSVAHAKQIVSSFSDITKRRNINAAIKLQFRDLDSFIHPDFKDSDLKYIKRFKETELKPHEFNEILEFIRENNLQTMVTPFDNASLGLIKQMNVDIIKVASCSIDDWPLLREIATSKEFVSKRVFISTAGANFDILDRVYELFKSNFRSFAFLHCVGEYPTPRENSNLKRIDQLRERYSDIEIGFSTHESPDEPSLVPIAVAKGCTIVEKHVGIGQLNAYSNTPGQMDKCIAETLSIIDAIQGESKTEAAALNALKRGVYVSRNLPLGSFITQDDVFFAMPCQEGQANASHVDLIVGHRIGRVINKNRPIMISDCSQSEHIPSIINKMNNILHNASISIDDSDGIEISCHYGLENFNEFGALIINKINREYCKKLIIQFAGQKHPTHHHVKKEETFELLHGDCELVLNNRKIKMQLGRSYIIARGVDHSFSTSNGCIVEEISTTHIKGDSIYSDPEIFKMKVDDRKIIIR